MAIPSTRTTRAGRTRITQGTLLDLYDPDRSQHVLYRGESREWAEFAEALQRKGGCDQGRNRPLLSERDHYFAHAGAAVAGGAEGISQGEAGAVRPGDGGDVP